MNYLFLKKKAIITLSDYWYVPETTQDYFDYKNNSTSHTLELQFSYLLNLKKNDNLAFKLATVIYGNDKKLSPAGNYKQAYSTYFEINYGIDSLFSKYGCEARMGFSLRESPANYMVEKFSWICAELKFDRKFELNDTDELTPSVAFTVNPKFNEAYISLGIAFSF